MATVTLNELSNKLKRITLPRVQEETAKIITADTKILGRKRDELKTGFNPDGSIIGEYRSPSYRLFKLQKNPLAGGKVDLILTGSTARRLGVDYLGNSVYQINSTDPKWEGLIAKYGDKIQAINPVIWDNLQKTEYAPKLVARIKQIAKL